MQFDYDRDIPPEILPVVTQLIESRAWMLPGWCHRVRVTWYQNGHPEGTLAACAAHHAYRGIDIDIYPALMSNGADRQAEILTHEMIHGLLGPLSDYARNEIKRLLPEGEAPKYRDSILDELRQRVESVTQDFAHAIHNREKLQKGLSCV